MAEVLGLEIEKAEQQLHRLLQRRGRKKKKSEATFARVSGQPLPRNPWSKVKTTIKITKNENMHNTNHRKKTRKRIDNSTPISFAKGPDPLQPGQKLDGPDLEGKTASKSKDWKRPASIRARLNAHMDEIRRDPVKRASLVKMAQHHLQEAATAHHKRVAWNQGRAQIRSDVVKKARIDWTERQSLRREEEGNVDIARAKKWWVLIKTASVVSKIPQIVTDVKEERYQRLQRAQRRRQRMRRRTQGLGTEANQAAAAAATMDLFQHEDCDTLLQQLPEEPTVAVIGEKENSLKKMDIVNVAVVATAVVVDGDVNVNVKGNEVKNEEDVKGDEKDPTDNANNTTVQNKTNETNETNNKEDKEITLKQPPISLPASTIIERPESESKFESLDIVTSPQTSPATKEIPTFAVKKDEEKKNTTTTTTTTTTTKSTIPKLSITQPISPSRPESPSKTSNSLSNNTHSDTYYQKKSRSRSYSKDSTLEVSIYDTINNKHQSDQSNIYSGFRTRLVSKSNESEAAETESVKSVDVPLDPRLFTMGEYDWCVRAPGQEPLLPRRRDGADRWLGFEDYKTDVQRAISMMKIDPLLDEAARIAGLFGVNLHHELAEKNLLISSAMTKNVNTKVMNHNVVQEKLKVQKRNSLVITASEEHHRPAVRRLGVSQRGKADSGKSKGNGGDGNKHRRNGRIGRNSITNRRNTLNVNTGGNGDNPTATLIEEERLWAQRMMGMLSSDDYAKSSYDRVTRSFIEVCKVRKNALKHTSILILDVLRARRSEYFTAPKRPSERPKHNKVFRTTKIFVPSDTTPTDMHMLPAWIPEPFIEGGNDAVRTRDRLKETPPGYDPLFVMHARERLKDLATMDRLIDETMRAVPVIDLTEPLRHFT